MMLRLRCSPGEYYRDEGTIQPEFRSDLSGILLGQNLRLVTAVLRLGVTRLLCQWATSESELEV